MIKRWNIEHLYKKYKIWTLNEDKAEKQESEIIIYCVSLMVSMCELFNGGQDILIYSNDCCLFSHLLLWLYL